VIIVTFPLLLTSQQLALVPFSHLVKEALAVEYHQCLQALPEINGQLVGLSTEKKALLSDLDILECKVLE